jgi:acyl-[acyl carrier protein]--UDP-N-acetylglucosamine O-acyltransferase
VLTRSKKNTSQAVDEIRKSMADSADVKELVEFVEKAERGIVK